MVGQRDYIRDRVRLPADMHVSPRTVGFLRALGHDVVRVNEVMPVTSTDEAIVLRALDDERVVLTQDLRFSAVLGHAGQRSPSFDFPAIVVITDRVRQRDPRTCAAARRARCGSWRHRDGRRQPDPDAPTAYPIGSCTCTARRNRVIGRRDRLGHVNHLTCTGPSERNAEHA
jgi:predicted nuclease of predicted toxin-antitoxin system